jgi:hypothetical protein
MQTPLAHAQLEKELETSIISITTLAVMYNP